MKLHSRVLLDSTFSFIVTKFILPSISAMHFEIYFFKNCIEFSFIPCAVYDFNRMQKKELVTREIFLCQIRKTSSLIRSEGKTERKSDESGEY